MATYNFFITYIYVIHVLHNIKQFQKTQITNWWTYFYKQFYSYLQHLLVCERSNCFTERAPQIRPHTTDLRHMLISNNQKHPYNRQELLTKYGNSDVSTLTLTCIDASQLLP